MTDEQAMILAVTGMYAGWNEVLALCQAFELDIECPEQETVTHLNRAIWKQYPEVLKAKEKAEALTEKGWKLL